MSDAFHRMQLARAFFREMIARGVTDLADPALVYHLAVLLRPEGHPTIKAEPLEELKVQASLAVPPGEIWLADPLGHHFVGRIKP